MGLKEITQIVKGFLFEIFEKNAEIIGIVPCEEGWRITAEILMDEDYTIKRGRNDLIDVYEVIVDKGHNVTCYERKHIRERGKLME